MKEESAPSISDAGLTLLSAGGTHTVWTGNLGSGNTWQHQAGQEFAVFAHCP